LVDLFTSSGIISVSLGPDVALRIVALGHSWRDVLSTEKEANVNFKFWFLS
jgi:hypothetical protein